MSKKNPGNARNSVGQPPKADYTKFRMVTPKKHGAGGWISNNHALESSDSGASPKIPKESAENKISGVAPGAQRASNLNKGRIAMLSHDGKNEQIQAGTNSASCGERRNRVFDNSKIHGLTH